MYFLLLALCQLTWVVEDCKFIVYWQCWPLGDLWKNVSGGVNCTEHGSCSCVEIKEASNCWLPISEGLWIATSTTCLVRAMALYQSVFLCFIQANNWCITSTHVHTLILDVGSMCIHSWTWPSWSQLLSFDCSIVSGLNNSLDVSGCYNNNCSDGVFFVLVLCQFQIGMHLELVVCWRRYYIGNVNYDMDNFDVCLCFVSESNTSVCLWKSCSESKDIIHLNCAG